MLTEAEAAAVAAGVTDNELAVLAFRRAVDLCRVAGLGDRAILHGIVTHATSLASVAANPTIWPGGLRAAADAMEGNAG